MLPYNFLGKKKPNLPNLRPLHKSKLLEFANYQGPKIILSVFLSTTSARLRLHDLAVVLTPQASAFETSDGKLLSKPPNLVLAHSGNPGPSIQLTGVLSGARPLVSLPAKLCEDVTAKLPRLQDDEQRELFDAKPGPN
jgi:hypothetical protein